MGNPILLWFVFLFMIAIVILTVVWLWHRGYPSNSSDDQAVSVYRDQLMALDHDVSCDLIGNDEFHSAKAEISRRLLDAAGNNVQSESGYPRYTAGYRVPMFVFLLVLISSLSIYLLQGRPDLPGHSLVRSESDEFKSMIVRVEAYLSVNPNNADGWETLAPIYLHLKRYNDAVYSFARVLRLLGPNARRLSDLGEALTLANGGVVTTDAKEMFIEAHQHDSDLVAPRFYLALFMEHSGDFQQALDAWMRLAADAPDATGWLHSVEEHIVVSLIQLSVSSHPGENVLRSSSAETYSNLDGTIGRLAARLVQDDKELSDWLRLVHAYVILEKNDAARSLLSRARHHFSGDDGAFERLAGFSHTILKGK